MTSPSRDRLFLGATASYPREALMYDGTFLSCIDGGYPLLYLTDQGAILCADCATRNDSDDPDDLLLGADIFYEGPPATCLGCDILIESAYGDPDANDS